jgi:hypothetical protein
MNQAPVILFVYNRPWHTRQTVEALQKNRLAGDSDLFVFSDAPGKPDAFNAVQEVRDYIKSIHGFKTVSIIERKENLGLAASIIDGVTRLCDEYDRVIVIEDDLATSPHFLEYMNMALDFYAGEDRVMQIAGYMFPIRLEFDEDAFFLPFISSWGWATWKRAWRHFDPQAQAYERLHGDSALRKQFDLDGHYSYFKMLRAQQEGRVDSWAIRWYLSVFMRKGLALHPKRTLVRNLGFDGSGVNCAVSGFDQDELETGFRVVSLPSRVDVSPSAENIFRNMPVSRLSAASIMNRLSSFFRGS